MSYPVPDNSVSSTTANYSLTTGAGDNPVIVILVTFNAGIGGTTCSAKVDGVSAVQRTLASTSSFPGIAAFTFDNPAPGDHAITITVAGVGSSFTASQAFSWFNATFDNVAKTSVGASVFSNNSLQVAPYAVVCSLISAPLSVGASLSPTFPLQLDARPTATTALAHSQGVGGLLSLRWDWQTLAVFTQVDLSLKPFVAPVPGDFVMMGAGPS